MHINCGFKSITRTKKARNIAWSACLPSRSCPAHFHIPYIPYPISRVQCTMSDMEMFRGSAGNNAVLHIACCMWHVAPRTAPTCCLMWRLLYHWSFSQAALVTPELLACHSINALPMHSLPIFGCTKRKCICQPNITCKLHSKLWIHTSSYKFC